VKKLKSKLLITLLMTSWVKRSPKSSRRRTSDSSDEGAEDGGRDEEDDGKDCDVVNEDEEAASD
jgi:hypothetical protein